MGGPGGVHCCQVTWAGGAVAGQPLSHLSHGRGISRVASGLLRVSYCPRPLIVPHTASHCRGPLGRKLPLTVPCSPSVPCCPTLSYSAPCIPHCRSLSQVSLALPHCLFLSHAAPQCPSLSLVDPCCPTLSLTVSHLALADPPTPRPEGMVESGAAPADRKKHAKTVPEAGNDGKLRVRRSAALR